MADIKTDEQIKMENKRKAMAKARKVLAKKRKEAKQNGAPSAGWLLTSPLGTVNLGTVQSKVSVIVDGVERIVLFNKGA